jgi:N-acetylglutamate synthase-like GNAT family acetyltransferase
MRVRKAATSDLLSIVGLARSLDLDYPGMEGDALWVAEADRDRIVGAVALKKHPDCLELCALGVDPGFRGKGLAKALVEALVAGAPGAVHLATIIPGFFESCGFRIIKTDIPATFPAKRKTAWCEGCPRERCTVMLRKKP